MNRRTANRVGRVRARGFSLVLVVFVLVTLTALAGFILTVSQGQQESSIADEAGTKAYLAARSGLEWGAYQILQSAKTSGAYEAACSGGSTTQNIAYTTGSLSGHGARVACTSSGAETEGTATVRVYRLVATGCNQTPCLVAPALPAAPGYVERELQLTLTR